MTNADDITQRASKIELLLMDVDGVLTDGKLLYVPMPDGSVVEAKAFDATDGARLAMARRAGIRLGIISGRGSAAVTRRAEELRIEFVYLGLGSKKTEAFNEILSKAAVHPDQVCYVGDDLPDIPILRRVGFPVGVANACLEVKQSVAYITHNSGGHGAMREVVELILRAQGKWNPEISL